MDMDVMKSRMTTILPLGVGMVILTGLATPASAWWQFIALDHGQRKASAKFETEQECKAQLKRTEEALKKAFPNTYPLVGSCEEYRPR